MNNNQLMSFIATLSKGWHSDSRAVPSCLADYTKTHKLGRAANSKRAKQNRYEIGVSVNLQTARLPLAIRKKHCPITRYPHVLVNEKSVIKATTREAKMLYIFSKEKA